MQASINILNINEAKARILFLQEEITNHDKLYEQNSPIISDTEYDNLYKELVELEHQYPEFKTPDSPTQRIVTVIVDGLEKVVHSTPMLSQDKVHTEEDIRKFVSKSNSRILAQLKLDGLTIVLKYNNGRFVQAVTRGTGFEGEDTSHTIITSPDVPKHIAYQGEIELRAEAIITTEDFKRINETVEVDYASPRNLASGTVRQLDAKIAQERNIRVIAFDVVTAEGKSFKTDEEQLIFMKQLGFNVVHYEIFENTKEGIDSLVQYCTTFNDTKRSLLPYEIDGLVLKFDDLATRLELGYTSKFPRWGCAFKFESLNATTTLERVVHQVGKTGQITPVAEFQTVNIAGVSINRASLHNYKHVSNEEYIVGSKKRMGKDIQVGDRILVERANDVIPKVAKSFSELRSGNEQVIAPPTNCPSCGSPTEFDGVELFCTGLDCVPQLEGKLEHFVSRKTLNIDGLGEKTVKLLLKEGFISSMADIFRLHEKELEITTLDGFGQKKFDKMIEGIEKAKSNPLHKVLYALSIRHVGESATKDLAKLYKTMDEIIEDAKDVMLFEKKLLSIKDFGEKMARSMIDFFTNEKNLQIIHELKEHGFEMVSEYTQVTAGSTFEGKTFVITGKLSKGRDEFKDLIESLGGKVSGSVSKKTSYLLMGDGEEGSSKHQKALELGTEIINEAGFEALL